jgi:spore coat protein A, manganese oxidase
MNTVTRRRLVQGGMAAGAGVVLSGGQLTRAANGTRGGVAAPPLDPMTIPKYVEPLVIPPAMPQGPQERRPADLPAETDYYEIAVRQFQQPILPARLGLQTTVWSYGAKNQPDSFHSPAFTIEATVDRPVRVKWVNELMDANGNFLPHLLPVDPTLHWANPGGGATARDQRPRFRQMPEAYAGPVPIVVHLHGGHNAEESDGFTEAWYPPAARNLPARFAPVGSRYDEFAAKFAAAWGQAWEPGTAVFRYANDQRAATLWFHDHTLGMTRLNVYAGPAGFYLLRGGESDRPPGVLPGAAPARGDPAGTRYFEIPLAIQDRSFTADGALRYPSSRAVFDDFEGPYIPDSDVSPIWNPEVFGDTMVVNGRTWPVLEVEPRRYRFRFLNGCNSRFLILKLVTDPRAPRPVPPALPFQQIGSDGGFLPAPATLDDLLLAPAERADVIVDFTGLREGSELYLINEGPDEPFGGGTVGTDFPAADPETTGQVLKLVLIPRVGKDRTLPADQLTLPARAALGPETVTRRVSLNEEMSKILAGVGPTEAVLGTVDAEGPPIRLDWDEPITETPALHAVEVWELHNFTEDAHPIHIHEVQFQVLNREPFDGGARQPEPWETGDKDTVIAYPDEITRVKARFDHPGLFVWHCHILEHEDNEMMRPLRVEP